LGKNTQSVTIGIGALIAHLVVTPIGIDFDVMNDMRRYLLPIWPVAGDLVWPPSAVLTDTDAERVATVLQRTLAPVTKRWVP
jgi:hypothetical protein